jgi:nitrite reductase (NADH) large subunit
VAFVPERDQMKPDLPLLAIGRRALSDVPEGSAQR